MTEHNAITRIGYIGLGDIGSGMAANLTKRSGLKVMVYDLRPEALVGAVEFGAMAGKSLPEVAAFADVIHLCLVYDQQIADAIMGPDGLLAHSRPGQVIVVHSTIFPSTVQRCADAARAKGVEVLDVPVTGEGRTAAAAGQLNLLVGGEKVTVERYRKVLETMGTVYHLGDVGAGQAMKLTNNVMFHCNRLVYLEALRIAAAFGINEATVDEIVSKGTGMSYAQVHHARPDSHGEAHACRFAGAPAAFQQGSALRHAHRPRQVNLSSTHRGRVNRARCVRRALGRDTPPQGMKKEPAPEEGPAGGAGITPEAPSGDSPPDSAQAARTEFAVAAATFIWFAGTYFVTPFLPLYVQKLGDFSLQETALWTGVSLALTPLVAGALAPAWGMLADRYGRKLLIQRSLLGFTLCLGLMGIAQTPLQLMIIRSSWAYSAASRQQRRRSLTAGRPSQVTRSIGRVRRQGFSGWR